MNKNESAIFNIIKKNPHLNVENIAIKSKLSLRSVKYILSSLKEKKLIRRINGKRFGYWEVIDNDLSIFSRLERLLGKEKIESLKDKKVMVFGLGGVGGNVVDALVRSGIGHFMIVDNDVVNITNINRQLIANMNTIGRNKVDVMEEHILSINPSAKVIKKKCFYLPEKGDEFDFANYDYIVDAIDTVSAKIDIIFRCKRLQRPIISALGCGNKINPTMLEVSDISLTSYDPLAKVIRKELRNRGIEHLKVVYSKETPITPVEEIIEEGNKKRSIPGSTSFVPPVAGIIIASEVVKDLLDYKN